MYDDDLFESGLDKVGLVNESLFEVSQTVFLHLLGLCFTETVWVPNLGKEGCQIVQFHLLPPLSLLLLLLLLSNDLRKLVRNDQ